MNLHDPARPKGYAEVPMYVSPIGRAIGALHSLDLVPLVGQQVELRGWWRVEGRSSRCYEVIVAWGELLGFLKEFEEDPEKVMREKFGWSYREGAPARAPKVKADGVVKPVVVVDLADLGF